MAKPTAVTPENQDLIAEQANTLRGNGGDGTTVGMDARVTRLETHLEYVRESLSEIKANQKESNQTLATLSANIEKLPTKSDLWTWKLQWLGIALVAFATIVGGIIGGLDWIKTH